MLCNDTLFSDRIPQNDLTRNQLQTMTYRNDTGDASEYAVMNPIKPATSKNVIEDESVLLNPIKPAASRGFVEDEYAVMKNRQPWTG